MPRILKLDRMEIHGFKSFYGRTRFDFPSGITAVVGPNGCGKSNIGDAISWVLGEQKASSLRSDRMEDVIFNGSEGRRPLGMAEVSLHFKNLLTGEDGDGSGNGHAPGNGHGGNGNGRAAAAVADPPAAPILDDHEVPIAVAQEGEPTPAAAPPETASPGPLAITGIEEIPDQVIVTRRIYRSGESEYILNGERCRLKDIQDLLAKTDIGSRLYSTIEQGKIDQVLAAKPKDRRAMFEEAAGILGYRSKRRQAEMKLEAAQANLLRINDIVVEVEKQINTLRRQAARARRYQRLSDELKEGRLGLLRHRLAVADGEREETGRTIDALRAEETAGGAALAADDAELLRLRLLLEEGEAEARRRREAIHALDLEIDRIQERLRAGREQIGDLETRLGDGGRETADLQARLSEQDARLRAIVSEIEALDETLGASRSSTCSVADGDGARAAEIEARETALEGARARLLETIETLAATTRRTASLEEQSRLGRAALERIDRESSDLATSRRGVLEESEALAREAETGRERSRASACEHEAAAEAARAATEGVREAEKRAEELKGRAAVLAERLAALAEMERQHAGFSDGVGDILRGSAGVDPKGVVGDRLDVPRGLEKAVEATLGDLLEAVLIGGPEEAARGVAYLRGSGRGRVSFVSEEGAGETQAPAAPEGIPDGDRLSARIGGAPGGPVSRILARTLLVDDLDQALRRHAETPAWAYVTPQGDIVRLDGSVTGGDGRALQHWLLQRRAEKEEIARRAAETAGSLDAAESTIGTLRAELDAALERSRITARAVQEEDRLAFERDLKSQQARAALDRIERALPLLQAERARLERDLAAWGGELSVASGRLDERQADRRAIESSIQSQGAELLALRSELERSRRASAEAQAALAAAEERRQSLARERDGLGAAAGDLRATLDRRGREIAEWTERVAQIRAQESELDGRCREALTARAEAAARDEAAHAGLAYERGLLLGREQAVKEGRARLAELRERQQQHELRRARAEADLEHLERACRDELSTTIDALRATPITEGAALEEREAEVARIRSEIDSIGPVNLMAVEQQKDLEERFAFLSAQKKDLEDAIESLRDTIRTINREARERFRSAFESIQGHFQECFTTLFGGGAAELRLSEGDEDVLEAGIEIVAQPPGKRLQKIALLSGGEKALTAVALLVSLFRHRPSPFCILDEVDAPLDEANVERFTKLLQQLRSDTQFILITHNRKSMEAADLLYGVTMEEPGVSKILPLRFE